MNRSTPPRRRRNKCAPCVTWKYDFRSRFVSGRQMVLGAGIQYLTPHNRHHLLVICISLTRWHANFCRRKLWPRTSTNTVIRDVPLCAPLITIFGMDFWHRAAPFVVSASRSANFSWSYRSSSPWICSTLNAARIYYVKLLAVTSKAPSSRPLGEMCLCNFSHITVFQGCVRTVRKVHKDKMWSFHSSQHLFLWRPSTGSTGTYQRPRNNRNSGLHPANVLRRRRRLSYRPERLLPSLSGIHIEDVKWSKSTKWKREKR